VTISLLETCDLLRVDTDVNSAHSSQERACEFVPLSLLGFTLQISNFIMQQRASKPLTSC